MGLTSAMLAISLDGKAQVTTNATLNYEAQNTYQLSITVTVLGLSTTGVLSVNVIDVNEPLIITNLPKTINVAAASTSAGDQVDNYIFRTELSKVADRCVILTTSLLDVLLLLAFARRMENLSSTSAGSFIFDNS